MEEVEKLSQIEVNKMLRTVYEYVNQYEELKGLEVCFETFADGTSLALFSQPGAHVVKRFVTGGFRGFLPFCLVYRSNPTNDNQRLKKPEYLSALSGWMADSTNYPDLENIEIEEIEQTSVPYQSNTDESGVSDYMVTFNLYYRKED